MTRALGLAELCEVSAVLATYGGLLCAPAVEIDEDGFVSLSVRIKPEDQPNVGGAMDTLEAFHRLQYLVDICQLRALAGRYDIDPARLEALLPKEEA